MIFLGILVSFIIFSVIVLLHEYGHYKTARIFGIHIEEFGLGIPPRAKKLGKNKAGTIFSLNWIPLGGFVKIAGESEIFLSYYNAKGNILSQKKLEENIKSGHNIFTKKGEKISVPEKKYILAKLESHKDGRNFYEKNIFAKSLVLLAGVIMNFILAFVIFTVLFLVGVQPIGINSVIENPASSKIIPSYEDALRDGLIIESPGILLSPIEGSIAEKSGIITGDILVQVGENKITDIPELQEIISQSVNSQIRFTLIRNKQEIILSITPGAEGKIGSYLSPNITIDQNFIHKYSLKNSIKYATLETYSQIRLTLSGLGMLIKNIFSPETPQDRQDALESVAGPIGIVGVITQSLSGGFTLLLILGAIISINLGVFNLLPVPALDGGRLLLLWIRSAIDTVFGKSRISGEIENLVHVLFFLTLIALSILIAYNDIIRLILD